MVVKLFDRHDEKERKKRWRRLTFALMVWRGCHPAASSLAKAGPCSAVAMSTKTAVAAARAAS
jgi:hypothetical protein